MNHQFIFRAGAACMVISGAALGYSYISHPHHMSPDVIASTGWIVIHVLFAVSLALGLMGTIAVYAAFSRQTGWLGLLGLIILAPGMLLIFGLDYYEFLIAPYLAQHYPQVIVDHGAGDTMGPVAVIFPLSGMLTVLGYILLGLAWFRAHSIPRGISIALVLTAACFGFGLSPLGELAAARISAAAFGVALMAVGVCVWRITRQHEADPA